MKKVLMFQGGWQGHKPAEISAIFKDMLEKEGCEVELYDTVECLDRDLTGYDLIVPMWTDGQITNQVVAKVAEAVAAGTGIAGCHGGMCDAFRSNCDWQFLTGAQWVAHPGNAGVTYTVNLGDNQFTGGLEDFTLTSEKYYIHYDPAVKVYATTTFEAGSDPFNKNNGDIVMPVVMTRMWGEGKSFYCTLGHAPEVFDIPQAYEIMRRGFMWAIR